MGESGILDPFLTSKILVDQQGKKKYCEMAQSWKDIQVLMNDETIRAAANLPVWRKTEKNRRHGCCISFSDCVVKCEGKGRFSFCLSTLHDPEQL